MSVSGGVTPRSLVVSLFALTTLVSALLCGGSAIAAPAPDTGDLPPHVATSVDTESCAICHRGHTSANPVDSKVTTGSAGNALLAGGPLSGDKGLCYSCHGVEMLGSETDIQSSFDASSGHLLSPDESSYGPQFKGCGSCHDAHGSARDASGNPYAALLRVKDASSTEFNSGDAVCTACHTVRPGNLFPGMAVWRSTAHAGIATDLAGTGIVCVACHDSHGSMIAPAITSAIPTPALPATVAVTANDRTFCLLCHSGGLRVWPGNTVFATGAHATSPATVAVTAEYASVETSRAVGDCQACHTPMGSADASGALIPDLLAAQGRFVCVGCHSSSGSASTDFAALAWSSAGTGAELFASFSASASPAFDRTYVFSRDSSASGAPVGPSESRVVDAVGPMARGDVDADGLDEIVVADAAAAGVAILDPDLMGGTSFVSYALPGLGGPAAQIAVGQVFDDLSGAEEIVVVDGPDTLVAFRLDAGALSSVASTGTTGVITGIATGDVSGGAADEIAVVTAGPDMLRVVGAAGAALLQSAESTVVQAPTAVAVGDLDDETLKAEIAIALAGATTNAISLHQGDAAIYAYGGGPLPVTDPVAIAIGDVLTLDPVDTSGAEIALIAHDPTGSALLRVITQADGGGVGSVDDIVLPDGTLPTSLDAGDADDDGDIEMVVGLAGTAAGSATPVPPSVRVYGDSAGSPALEFSLAAGGTELAGGDAHVLVADIGAVPPSRHPASVVASAHVAGEQVPARRHAECVDCHDPHEAVAAGTATLQGELVGAMGVIDGAPTVRATATAEYQVCYSCHSSWDPSAVRDVATEFDPAGDSYHPIEASARPVNSMGDTLEGALASGDTVLCGACHGRADAGPSGPHRSSQSPLLARPFTAARALDAGTLCRECHRADVYVDGSAEDTTTVRSGFYDGRAGVPAAKRTLHAYHAGEGITCRGCHEAHAAAEKHLLSEGAFSWTERAAVGGECVSSCHNDSLGVYSYEW